MVLNPAPGHNRCMANSSAHDPQVCAVVDAQVSFLDGGSLAVQGFRLDVDGAAITERKVGLLLVARLGLLLTDQVRVTSLTFVREPHRSTGLTTAGVDGMDDRPVRLVELSHLVEHGMVTYPGLPGPEVGVHLSRADSRASYAPGTEFEIGRVTMVANTGTYLDAPSHRFEGGPDVSQVPLERVAALLGAMIDLRGSGRRGIDAEALAAFEVRGRAVLLLTGWSRHWRSERYPVQAPFLSADGAQWLAGQGAALVGIDSINIDDMADTARPAHTALLAAGIPVVEHLTGLDGLPAAGFTFHAAPVRVRGLGTFPVRAFAVVPDPDHVAR